MRMFWRLLGFLRPYRAGVVWSMVLAALAISCTVLVPYLTGRAIDAIDHQDRGLLTALGLAVAGAVVARMAFTVLRRLIAGRVSLGVEYDLRQRLYAHLQRLELGFFDHQQTGQLMSRTTVDLQAVRFFLGYGLIFLMQSALTLLLAAAMMFALQPELAALALTPVPFVVIVAARFGRQSRPAVQEVQQRIAELTAEAEENIAGVRVVKAFAREQRQLARFRHSVGRVFDQAMEATRIRAVYTPLIGFLPQIGLAVVLFLGGRQVIDGHITTGDFAAFYTYLLVLISPMRTLGVFLGMAQRATASGARIFQVLDREPGLPIAPDAPALPDGRGHVELRDVTLRYPTADSAGDAAAISGTLMASGAATARRAAAAAGGDGTTASGRPDDGAAPASHRHPTAPALAHVTLDVPAGTTLALVGATASGKTSLASLIPRLYDVTEGAVLVDGADVRDVDPTSLRSQIAVVDDDPFLFSETVHDNIAYTRPDASRADVERAARRAQAHEFIVALPDGYDTLVGERGLTLSGGQRQRLAIARALLADPRILILDDATSSVDASTEQQIKAALREVMRGRTTFVIAHRLSTIALADEIAVLERGELVAHGRHDELLQQSGLYREIVEKGLPDQVFLTRAGVAAGDEDVEDVGL